MNAERPYFIPLSELKRGTVTSVEGLTGDDLLAEAARMVEAHYRSDPDAQHRAMEELRKIQEVASFNAPALLIDRSLHGDPVLQEAGYLTTELHLVKCPEGKKPYLKAGITYESDGDWIVDYFECPLDTFLFRAVTGTTDFLIGEENTRRFLEERGEVIYEAARSDAIVYDDTRVLYTAASAHFPVSYFGFSNEQRGSILDRYMERIISASPMEYEYDVMEYIAGAHSDEQKKVLYAEVIDRLLPSLPVGRHDERDRRLSLGNLLRIADKTDMIMDGVATKGAKRAAFMESIYRRRAEQLASETPSVEPGITQSCRQPSPGLWPEHERIYSATKLSPEEMWRFVDHLNYLREQNVPVDILHRTQARMISIEACLNKLLIEYANPQDMHQIYDALEYVFEVTDEYKVAHYNMIGRTLALILPLRDGFRRSLNQIAKIVGEYAQRLPHPPTDSKGRVFTGEAATAAVMAQLYRRRFIELYEAGLNRTDDNGENINTGNKLGEVLRGLISHRII